MIALRRALKPDTYKDFLLTVGYLLKMMRRWPDRKYDKQNFGVVTNYETAMNCWYEEW